MRGNRRGGGRGGGRRVFTLSGKSPFNFQVGNTNTSSAATLSASNVLVPNNLRNAFEFYRFRRVSLSLAPVSRFETSWPASSNAACWSLGYLPEITLSTLTSISQADVASLADSITGSASVVNVNSADESGTNTGKLLLPGDTVRRSLRVSPRTLNLGLAKMWRCNPSGTTDDPSTIQGTFIFAVTDAAGANLVRAQGELSWTVDLFEPLNAAGITLAKRLSTVTDEEKSFISVDEEVGDHGGTRPPNPAPPPRLVGGRSPSVGRPMITAKAPLC